MVILNLFEVGSISHSVYTDVDGGPMAGDGVDTLAMSPQTDWACGWPLVSDFHLRLAHLSLQLFSPFSAEVL